MVPEAEWRVLASKMADAVVVPAEERDKLPW